MSPCPGGRQFGPRSASGCLSCQNVLLAQAADHSSLPGAVDGRPWVVWIEGQPGSGKTALVRQAVRDLPDGFMVVRAQADELATDIPYELAGQLGATNPEGPFAAGMNILEAWSHAQDRGAVAVVVEDLHWADTGFGAGAPDRGEAAGRGPGAAPGHQPTGGR